MNKDQNAPLLLFPSRISPLAPSKVRLIVSYGAASSHGHAKNQLAYVNGETKILSRERSLLFADFAMSLASLAGNVGNTYVKY